MDKLFHLCFSFVVTRAHLHLKTRNRAIKLKGLGPPATSDTFHNFLKLNLLSTTITRSSLDYYLNKSNLTAKNLNWVAIFFWLIVFCNIFFLIEAEIKIKTILKFRTVSYYVTIHWYDIAFDSPILQRKLTEYPWVIAGTFSFAQHFVKQLLLFYISSLLCAVSLHLKCLNPQCLPVYENLFCFRFTV